MKIAIYIIAGIFIIGIAYVMLKPAPAPKPDPRTGNRDEDLPSLPDVPMQDNPVNQELLGG